MIGADDGESAIKGRAPHGTGLDDFVALGRLGQLSPPPRRDKNAQIIAESITIQCLALTGSTILATYVCGMMQHGVQMCPRRDWPEASLGEGRGDANRSLQTSRVHREVVQA